MSATSSAVSPAPAASVAPTAPADAGAKRVAVVTGAAQGIGAGIAVRLAKDGLDLVLSDLPGNRANLERVAEECRANGARVVLRDCDVVDEAQVAQLVESTKELGGIDGESSFPCPDARSRTRRLTPGSAASRRTSR